jgi:tetratricopeptide (TPR) repeat protein
MDEQRQETPETGLARCYCKVLTATGCLLMMQKNFQEAAQHMDKAIEFEPHVSVHYSNRAGLYNQIGKYELALQDATRAIELCAILPRARHYYHRACANKALGDLIAAVRFALALRRTDKVQKEDVNKVLAQHPNEIEAKIVLAQVNHYSALYVKLMHSSNSRHCVALAN